MTTPKYMSFSIGRMEGKMDNLNLSPEKLNTLKDELQHLLNRLSIDNELGTPDFILAEMITEQINSMVVARRKTKKHKGEGEKSIQLSFVDSRGSEKATVHFEIEKTLKVTYKEVFTDNLKDILDLLFNIIYSSGLREDQLSSLNNHLYFKFTEHYSYNIYKELETLITSASVYAENFPYNSRYLIQERARKLFGSLKKQLPSSEVDIEKQILNVKRD